MKNEFKKINLVLAAIIFIFPFEINAEKFPTINLFINGSYVQSDVQPIIEDGRTLVPVRIVTENFGCSVEWNEEKKEVSIFNPNLNKKINLIIGNNNASSENISTGEIKNISLDVPPKIFNERTMIPIRFIAEEFGQKIDWDDKNKTVILGDGYENLVEIEATKNSNEIENIDNHQDDKFYDNLTESPYPDRKIKGNINSKNEKIYHCPGQRDYKKTEIDESKGEMWFATEEEARNAGWRRAKK